MFNTGLISYVARVIGTSEPGLTLLFSVLSAYPLAIIYRLVIQKQSPCLQHIFFMLCGVGIGFFNFGGNVIHSLISVFILNIILLLIGGTLLSVCITLVFYMGYLITAYYYTATDDYDIKWTIPQCVLTLRLIALSYDMYDGQIDEERLSTSQRETALRNKPTLLEIAGHTFFFGGFIVGPQFSMKRYQDLVNGKLCQDSDQWISLIPGLKRGFVGLCYMFIFQTGLYFVINDDYLLSPAFYNLYLWKKFAVISIWSKITLSKYLAMWLLAEGSCIITGLTYNGKDEYGQELWDGCANVKIRKYEGAITFGNVIASFNINTNRWAAEYIYKRLKFLNNKFISQAVTLAFLAIWHGLHCGYYVCFLTEFFVVYMEKGMETLIYKNPKFSKYIENRLIRFTCLLIQKVYMLCFIGYCLVPFVLFSFDKWWHVYKSFYFIGHIIFFSWPFIFPLLKMALVPPKKKNVESKSE